MSLQEVYKYCRPWAIAQDPEERDGALTPIAPYAVDSFEPVDIATGHRPWKLTSTCRASYNRGWSKDTSAKAQVVPAAGGGASEREPHCSLEAMACIQHGGPANYKDELTIYQASSDRKALSRHHRHSEQARLLPHNVREARWYKCFRQWEGQWERREDSQTRVTGTEFSVLPAGYVPKNGHLPQRHILERYAHNGTDALVEPAMPSTQKACSNVGRTVPEEQRSNQKPLISKAWPKKAPGEACKENAATGGRQRLAGPFTKAGRRRSAAGEGLKGATYIKKPCASWLKDGLKEVPAKLKQSDLLAALKLKSSDKSNVKYFNNQHAVPNDAIYH